MKNGESRLCTPSEAPEKQTGLRPQSGFEKGGAAESGGLRLPRQLASDGYEHHHRHDHGEQVEMCIRDRCQSGAALLSYTDTPEEVSTAKPAFDRETADGSSDRKKGPFSTPSSCTVYRSQMCIRDSPYGCQSRRA